MPGGTTPAIEGPAVIMSGISAVCVCVCVRETESTMNTCILHLCTPHCKHMYKRVIKTCIFLCV